MISEQFKLQLANEIGCICEICRKGIWLKELEGVSKIPDHMVLYHKDGRIVNNKMSNLAFRCNYCASMPRITKKAFTDLPKFINKNHGHAGSAWYHRGTENKFLKPKDVEAHLADGWIKGRKIHTRPPNQLGKIMITNGTKNRYMAVRSTPPKGWWKGCSYFKAEYEIYEHGKKSTDCTTLPTPKPREKIEGGLRDMWRQLYSYTE